MVNTLTAKEARELTNLNLNVESTEELETLLSCIEKEAKEGFYLLFRSSVSCSNNTAQLLKYLGYEVIGIDSTGYWISW